MKNNLFVVLASALLCLFHTAALRAQGSLTPPGAPAPTMKTLAQIEARTPIASAPFIITNSGSYYLTSNLTVSNGSAITINANNVSLDLNGFTLFSTENPATTGRGIQLSGSGVTNIAIANGFISSGVTNNGSAFSGSGFGYGILCFSAINTRITGVSVCGCRFDGINLENPGVATYGSVVESCTVNTVGGQGIVASLVSGSMALNCWGIGITAQTVNNCSAASLITSGIYCNIANNCVGSAASGPQFGVYATTANNCLGNSNGGAGVKAEIANNCSGEDDSGGDGVWAQIATGCDGYSNTGIGVGAYIANSCYSSTGDDGISYKYNMP